MAAERTLSIETTVTEQKRYFLSGATLAVENRLEQLNILKDAVKKYERDILEALQQDLNKSEHEAYMTEIGIVLEEIRFISRRLKKWAKPKKAKTAVSHIGSKSIVIAEPYGTVLIIAPWNYPFQLAVSPLIGALAAGNTAVIKPSELAPAVSSVISKMMKEIFPPEYVSVIEGGVETNQELLRQKFDYIFFTGSVPVGKVVMEAAAKQLIPVTLELGGKSPCIVHKDADLKLAAQRIVFGKLTNAGQTCIAPDYLLVHKDVKNELMRALKQSIQTFYGKAPESHPAYGKIISERHFERLLRFLHNENIVTGGTYQKDALKIAPAIIDEPDWESPIMQEEIFGPLLPVIGYETIEDVIQMVQSRPKPLALYLFTNEKAVQNHILSRISFGGGCINDTLMHTATPYLPFGGVGESGIGSYHGHHSFKTFSHEKSVLKQTNLFDISFRYPSSKNGLRIIKKLLR
ncbi:aldehyde dehydrogenase [Bacillus paralicheniformis]|uniref:aldehyde dehydrogenase n=1 Tax=Bacillus paralicheniformis TaxID=1648923 RepID=UPI003D1AC6B8